MTPVYIVVAQDKSGHAVVSASFFASQKTALDHAVTLTKQTKQSHGVFESIAVVEIPEPEPIVTMKGD